MFTGIVSGKGNLKKIVKCEDYISLIIQAPKGFAKNLSKEQAYLLMESV